MLKILKTRSGKLRHKIEGELKAETPNVDNIMVAVEEFQKDNIDTIEKLKKKKQVELKKINGALKQTINAHGPITKILIGSASKRIYGSLLINPNMNERKKRRFSLRDILIVVLVGIILLLLL
jgi:hypothetical protein